MDPEAHALPPPPDVDGQFDFSDEDPTPIDVPESMEQVMETFRSPGIPTLTSERPTRPIIPPSVRWRRGIESE